MQSLIPDEVVSQCPLQLDLYEEDGPCAGPGGGVPVPAGEANQPVLAEVVLLHLQGAGPTPLILKIYT